MKRALFAALLFATPALAQPHGATDPATGSAPAANLNNSQDQQNQAHQPAIAHEVQQGPGAGDAAAIPTPTLSRPMTPAH